MTIIIDNIFYLKNKPAIFTANEKELLEIIHNYFFAAIKSIIAFGSGQENWNSIY